MSTPFDGGHEVADERDIEQGFEASRAALTQQLREIDEQLESYEELVEARNRAATALAALDGGSTSSKRVQWETIADYLVDHLGAKPGEIAAALEVPVANIYAHLRRQEEDVFDKRPDGIYLREGWEQYRRDEKDR
jgi:predicted DNA-binding protein YlxM (UPF0122 family)